MKNILFITATWPQIGEVNMYTDLMYEFSERNHRVSVVALNEKRNKQRTYLSEENGIKVLRVKCGNIQKINKYEKVISSILAGPKIKRAIQIYFPNEKFDLIILALSTTIIVPTIVGIKKKCNAKLYLLLKEFWPQDPVDLGAMKKNGFIWFLFRLLEKYMYSNADYIGTMSEAGIRYIEKNNKGLSNKLEVCPNSQRPRVFTKNNSDNIRRLYGIPDNKCVFIYGGNLGLSQGIDEMISSIRNVKTRKNIFFLIIGSGTEYNKVKKAFEQEDEQFIKVYQCIPRNDYEELVNACDVGLLFLNKNYTVPNVPSRLISYLLAGLPVIAAIDKTTDVGDILESYGCGIKLYNGDMDAFREAVDLLVDQQVRLNMGENSKKLLLEKYTTIKCYETIMRHFTNS